MIPRPEIEAAVEAILFAASEPVSRLRLVAAFEEDEQEEAIAALERVLERFAPASGRGVMAEEVAGGLRLVTRPELHPYLHRFFEAGGRGRLSMAALETLAIVAYRQPITAPEVQELRGVSSAGVLKTLLERRLVRIAGRKPVVGKPFLYCTTREFLLQFGLNDVRDLPPLEELEEMLTPAGEPAGLGGSRSEGSRRREAAVDPEAVEIEEER